MTVPGTNLEDLPDQPEEVVEAAEESQEQPQEEAAAEEHNEGIVEAVEVKGKDGRTQKLVPLSALLTERRLAKETLKAEREARQAIDAKVQEIMPWVEKIRANPDLVTKAEEATRPSAPTTLQPSDDIEAQEYANENGYITPTGELDIARGRRMLNWMDKRWEAKHAKQMAPLLQNEAQRTAQQHMDAARKVTIPDGSRLASDASINEAFGMLQSAPQMMADPQVAGIMTLVAAGLDLAKGRRTAPVSRADVSDPLLTEAPGGARRAPAANSTLLKMAAQAGLTDKEINAATGVSGRGKALE